MKRFAAFVVFFGLLKFAFMDRPIPESQPVNNTPNTSSSTPPYGLSTEMLVSGIVVSIVPLAAIVGFIIFAIVRRREYQQIN